MRLEARARRGEQLGTTARELLHVLEEARAVGLELVREELARRPRPRRGRPGILRWRLLGTSQFSPHPPVDPVENAAAAPYEPALPNRTPSRRQARVYAVYRSTIIPRLGYPVRSCRKERKNRTSTRTGSRRAPRRGGGRRSGAGHDTPEAAIVEHETVRVYGQLGLEGAGAVEVAVGRKALVPLLQPLDRELRPA